MKPLEITNLKKSFETPDSGRQLAVSVKEFALEEGEQVALGGESGRGKTTFLNLIAGILSADEGKILISGEDMVALRESERDRLRARRIGFVFQTFNLLQGYSALENVELAMRFGTGLNRSRAEELLKRVGLGERLNYRPQQLSTGQQQRVAVARALANHPSLILADEPTGNLDPANAADVIKLLCEICSEINAALLIVSHDPGILSRFGRKIDLSDLSDGSNGV